MSDLHYSGRTDVGRRRDHNEDALLLEPHENLFLVADGLGGYAAGEIASQLAVDAISSFFSSLRDDEDITWPADHDTRFSYDENVFMNAVYTANRRIFSASARYEQYRGMSTTIVGLRFNGRRYHVAHVGDSRCYRLRDGKLEQLTEDHSLLNAFRKATPMSPEAVAAFPYKNVILRALGTHGEVEVEVTSGEWKPGDIYLLCSDGLSGELNDEALGELVRAHSDKLDSLTRVLVDRACEAGGRDNVTVVAVKIPEDRTEPIARRRRDPEPADDSSIGMMDTRPM